MTNRDAIDSFRNKLNERNADSNYTNQFLYNVLLENSRWLIRREINKGNIYKNTYLFQVLKCQKVIETSTIDPCCPIKVNCKIYRTKNKLPNAWVDDNGPVIKNITSVDSSTEFFYTTPTTWQSKRNDPYQRMSKQMYTFYSEGYLWFPEHNPHEINVNGFWTDDISNLNDCEENKECSLFLDNRFMLPPWLEGEMFAKALEQIAGVTEKLPQDEQIDKNPNRKN